jgi:hypothetical protein
LCNIIFDIIVDKIEFFQSENGVILSSGIDGILPPKYFLYVLDAKTLKPFDPQFPKPLPDDIRSIISSSTM